MNFVEFIMNAGLFMMMCILLVLDIVELYKRRRASRTNLFAMQVIKYHNVNQNINRSSLNM